MAKKFKINASDGSIKRYSDVVPQEKRRYWYFTTHGIGPGMLPSDVVSELAYSMRAFEK